MFLWRCRRAVMPHEVVRSKSFGGAAQPNISVFFLIDEAAFCGRRFFVSPGLPPPKR
jgi:hypothetical protein